MRTILWFFYFFAYLIVAIPSLMKATRLRRQGNEKGHEEHVIKVTKNWADFLLRKAGAKVHIHGLENVPDETVLIVSNHQGNFDIPILLSSLNRKIGFISKKEVKKIPLIRTWMEHLDCIFMDRSNRRQAVKSILEGAKKLEQGQDIVIFPEGTRSKGGPVSRFKKGSFKLATRSKATILPITIDGSYRLMEANNNFIKPAEVHVTISKPIRVHQEYPDMDVIQLAEIVQNQIEDQLYHEEQKKRTV
ncbi:MULTISPECIES: lysophospholipid acyltransferase family protein [Bacillaceae]|nr:MULTISPECIES: lysophospholipid acyltransferase family protein [Bacillaceae]